MFNDNECEAVLLVDATNAFNCLNRQTAMRNSRTLCPLFATPVINIYRQKIDLFVGGKVLESKEGTTQGDPLAMAIYIICYSNSSTDQEALSGSDPDLVCR